VLIEAHRHYEDFPSPRVLLEEALRDRPKAFVGIAQNMTKLYKLLQVSRRLEEGEWQGKQRWRTTM
jgi:hypothetical protein